MARSDEEASRVILEGRADSLRSRVVIGEVEHGEVQYRILPLSVLWSIKFHRGGEPPPREAWVEEADYDPGVWVLDRGVAPIEDESAICRVAAARAVLRDVLRSVAKELPTATVYLVAVNARRPPEDDLPEDDVLSDDSEDSEEDQRPTRLFSLVDGAFTVHDTSVRDRALVIQLYGATAEVCLGTETLVATGEVTLPY